MSALRDKNLLFYSIHPKDQHSKDFMTELEKNTLLKKQFILICVNDPNIKIPDKILQLGTIPVLVCAGFNRPILGQNAVSWLKNGGFQEKANGMDFGALGDDQSNKFAYLGDEGKNSEMSQFFNADYNRGFQEKNSVLNQQFAKISDDSHITTFDDSSEMKHGIADLLEQRLTNLRTTRQTDVPLPVKKIGGLDSFDDTTNKNNHNNQSQSIAYNPNPFQNHNIKQPQLPFAMPQQMGQPQMPFTMEQPQLPFAMPMIAQRPTMPQLPFNMPTMPQQMGGGYRSTNPNL